jgi:hypothetical protein
MPLLPAEELKKFFTAADLDTSGSVSFQEVVNALTNKAFGVGMPEADAKRYAALVLILLWTSVDSVPRFGLILALPSAWGRHEVDGHQPAALDF